MGLERLKGVGMGTLLVQKVFKVLGPPARQLGANFLTHFLGWGGFP